MSAEGRIRPRVAERMLLDGVADAYRRLDASGLDGKIVTLVGARTGSSSPPFAPTERRIQLRRIFRIYLWFTT
jgi:hypothetical protein